LTSGARRETLPFMISTAQASCCLALFLAVACSDPTEKNDDDNPAGSGGSSTAGTKATAGGAGAGGASGGSAGTIGTAVPVCNELELEAPAVGFTYDEAAAPAATGGEIVDGTYFLTAQVMFETASGPTLALGRTSVTVEGDTWQEVSGDPEEESVNPDRHTTATLSLSGSTFTLSRTCPSEGDPQIAEYTVDDDGFTVYVEDAGKVFGTVFTKQ
jgi:hypothetical protein